jgi:hypothetical protein
MSFERARKVADAVLYEGYVLYPYRSSSSKNQLRWQFGVLAPAAWIDAGGCENCWTQTQLLIEGVKGPARLTGKVRFLQLQRRGVEDASGAAVASLECEGRLFTPWDEGVEREVDFAVELGGELSSLARVIPFSFAGGCEVEEVRERSGALAGRVTRELLPVNGDLRLGVEPDGELLKVTLHTRNLTPCAAEVDARDEALRSSFAGAHAFFEIAQGAFVSPREARAGACENVRTWPVLIGEEGERSVVLSSPIILDDYPQIAESPGDLCDATEIDEILTLRILTLTDGEKREARATDPRAGAILDRVEAMSSETLGMLHGELRSLRADSMPAPRADSMPAPRADSMPAPRSDSMPAPRVGESRPPLDAALEPWTTIGAPGLEGSPCAGSPAWWDPGADASVSPETDSVVVAGVPISKGSPVRLRPGKRRSDAQDMFLAGRAAVVQAVYLDVEDNRYVAVTLKDDPASDLHARVGRFLYFYPDELEPGEAAAP